jgi:hypothetical protein
MAAFCDARIFSPHLPHKTMDVLHVATAALARATDFLTFDKNQRALAAAAGLTVKF